MPKKLLYAAYHKVNNAYSHTVYYLKNPKVQAQPNNRMENNVAYSTRKEIEAEYVKSSKYWFQVLDAI